MYWRRQVVSKQISPVEFASHLVWLDGRPLLDTMEPYRRKLLTHAFMDRTLLGRRKYDMVLAGRAKKNWKSFDLIYAAIYCLLAVQSSHGNDGFIVANDEDQANDDLSLLKKFIAANPILANAVEVLQKAIVRIDGKGSLRILPARDAIGMHGKTYLFLGIDEMHGWRNYDVLEALARDPTRQDAIVWVTTYDGVAQTPGTPLFDMKQRGIRGEDPRMLFSWYSADFCTDPDFAELPPEQRANPSMASWGNDDYLEQQRRRLPAHKFRRLHLNLPGMPDGAYFSPTHVQDAIIGGRRQVPWIAEMQGAPLQYVAFVDMSGGSSDDAVLAIAHYDRATEHAVLDVLMNQSGRPPFNPRDAVARFAATLKGYHCFNVTGDKYAGNTFASDFQERGIVYHACQFTKHELYEQFEPHLNASKVELLDAPQMQEQFLGLVMRGQRIDHVPNEHDDWANGAAGAIVLAMQQRMGADGQVLYSVSTVNQGLEGFGIDADGKLPLAQGLDRMFLNQW
jgi:hypothetical protein